MKRPLILIVDDDSMMVEALSDMISEIDKYDVVSASDGVEALEFLKKNKRWGGLAKNKVDCIILDVKMPNMNGLEFLSAWRDSEYFFREMPIILLTAYEDKEIWQKSSQSINSMVHEYLKKPLDDGKKLTDTLYRLLFNYEQEYMREILQEKGENQIRKYEKKG
jgi:CheY-like chemotaxis protein